MFIGVDPGAGGAIAVVSSAGNLLGLVDMPTVEVRRGNKRVQRVDVAKVADHLRVVATNLRPLRPRVVIEAAAATPQMGVSSAFAFGESLGLVEGAAVALGLLVERVAPAVWMREFGLSGTGAHAKRRHREKAALLWPEDAGKFRRVRDHGRADAALIALWAEHEAARNLSSGGRAKS